MFAGRDVAVQGLGVSGLSAARALKAGGANPVLWDDKASAREEAEAAGFAVSDLQAADWSRLAALVLAPGIPLTHPEPHWSVKRARQAGIEVIGDIELFFRERARNASAGQGRGHHRHQRQVDHHRADRPSARRRRPARGARRQYRQGGARSRTVRARPDLCHRAVVIPDRARAARSRPMPRRCSTSPPTISTAMAPCKTTRASNPRSLRIFLLAAPR